MAYRADLGNAAVIDNDFIRNSFEENSSRRARSSSDTNASRRSQNAGADNDWHVRDGVPIVAHLDGNQPASSLAALGWQLSRSHLGNAQIRQTAIALYPVIEKPQQVFLCR